MAPKVGPVLDTVAAGLALGQSVLTFRHGGHSTAVSTHLGVGSGAAWSAGAGGTDVGNPYQFSLPNRPDLSRVSSWAEARTAAADFGNSVQRSLPSWSRAANWANVGAGLANAAGDVTAGEVQTTLNYLSAGLWGKASINSGIDAYQTYQKDKNEPHSRAVYGLQTVSAAMNLAGASMTFAATKATSEHDNLRAAAWAIGASTSWVVGSLANHAAIQLLNRRPQPPASQEPQEPQASPPTVTTPLLGSSESRHYDGRRTGSSSRSAV